MTATTVHEGTWWPADRAEAPYRYLPVEVPDGSAGLTVELTYDTSAGTLDLGCFGPDGFRGWSGGARSRYVVTADAATPGYLPGPLGPGEWRVALGLHRVAATGVPWRVVATTGPARVEPPPPAPPVPARPPRRALPAPAGWSWLAADLHAHTVHSDGTLTPDELACAAVEAGLDVLAVTDHNTVSHHPALPDVARRAGIVLLPGQEVTTDRGHANAFGDVGWVDFREPADAWVAEVDRRGGVLSVNHPLAADCSWRWPLERRPPLAEVWHWTWLDRRWGGPMAWWLAWGGDAIPVGGSDFHSPEQGHPLGDPTTWLLCPDGAGPAEALDALRAGRTAVSPGRDGPVLLRVDGELVAVDADGALLADPSGRRTPVHGDRRSFPDAAGPCWLEAVDGAVLSLCR